MPQTAGAAKNRDSARTLPFPIELTKGKFLEPSRPPLA